MDTKILSMKFLLPLVLLTVIKPCFSQDSLLSMLDDSSRTGTTFPVKSTFKAIHIINAQTVESPAKHDLNFIIMHRFGQLNDGAYNFFGLDNASIRLGLDYGITDRLGVGIGRSSLEKTFDGYAKYRLIDQTDGAKKFPVTISVLGALNHMTLRLDTTVSAKNKTTYVLEALIARKFSSALSLQISPTYIHFNRYPATRQAEDLFATMIGGRLKFTKRMAVTAEFNYIPEGKRDDLNIKNSLSLGFDIETGGHVFQLVFTNSGGMIESQYVGKTIGNWGDGDIFFGFNITRNFSLGKDKNKKKDW